MVFSSVPAYLDPPNWQPQPNHLFQQGIVLSNEPPPQLPPLPPPPTQHGGGGLAKPGSMAERARLAKLPQPEAGLKCPRCESSNTKFCYFNNYSLTQPRHFCKTCRRYWTRGGALRNVPVGGGCRRNKKSNSSSSSSKSPASSSLSHRHQKQNNIIGSSSSSPSATTVLPSEIVAQPFMNSLHNFTQFGNLALNNFGGGIQNEMGVGVSTTTNNDIDNINNGGGILSGVVQQFPFLEQPQAASSLYSFQNEGVEATAASVVGGSQQQLLRSMTSGSRVSQLAPVKMEVSNQQGLNLSSRAFLGISESSNQYWSGNPWTDLSGLNSSTSTTTHIL